MIESLIPHPWHLPIWVGVVVVACFIFCGAIRWQSAIRVTTAVIVLAVGFALGAVSSFAWPAECVAFPRGSIGDPRWLARYEWDVHEPESPHPPIPAP